MRCACRDDDIDIDIDIDKDDDRWQKVADLLPGKSEDDVKLHYQVLLCDVQDIESGLIHLPKYYNTHQQQQQPQQQDQIQIQIQKPTQSNHTAAERKKGRPWTQDEHRLFIKGLETYGKAESPTAYEHELLRKLSKVIGEKVTDNGRKKKEVEEHKCEAYEPPKSDERACRYYYCKDHPKMRKITNTVPAESSTFFGGFPFYSGYDESYPYRNPYVYSGSNYEELPQFGYRRPPGTLPGPFGFH
ncbi:hypothetical protein RD792_013500 [Penstemon davidsonii]|uniref:Myb-like domain-containing protein n=1 Tax=Penstemon davidsonii TaxID=160366 RepID=A0ABR0CTP9_9LAMI|nr:hypothetical protein RD792_013500 [Penstemon davidsonii]